MITTQIDLKAKTRFESPMAGFHTVFGWRIRTSKIGTVRQDFDGHVKN
jgi:hypothetical protein